MEKWKTEIFSKLPRVKLSDQGSPGGSVVKNPPANVGDTGSIPDLGRWHMPWSNKAHAPQWLSLCSEPGSSNYWTHVLQPLQPQAPKPVLCNEKPLQREAHILQLKEAPFPATKEKALEAMKTQHSQKKQKQKMQQIDNLYLSKNALGLHPDPSIYINLHKVKPTEQHNC